MTGRQVTIPADCRSIVAVYDILARELELPAYFGGNLDALWDSLTGDVAGPFEIIVENTAALQRRLGADGKTLVGLLRALRRARNDVKVTLRRGSRRRKRRRGAA